VPEGLSSPVAVALTLVLVLATSACASPGGAGPGGPPRGTDPRTMVPPGVKPEWLHFAEPAAAVGAPAPDFSLRTPDGGTEVPLSLFRGKPLVLVFGSFT
jgi:hypothetical protein